MSVRQIVATFSCQKSEAGANIRCQGGPSARRERSLSLSDRLRPRNEPTGAQTGTLNTGNVVERWHTSQKILDGVLAWEIFQEDAAGRQSYHPAKSTRGPCTLRGCFV